jgi:hypothetical protein
MKQYKITFYPNKNCAFTSIEHFEASEVFEALILWQKKEIHGVFLSITCLNPRS